MATVNVVRKTPTVGTIRLMGSLFVQRGKPILLACVRASDVVRQGKVDIYSPTTKTGYQRAAVPSRMRDVARYYEEGGLMPNPLLVNIREDDFENIRVVITDGDAASYERAVNTGGNWLGAGYIEIPADLPIWTYDGQHRQGGLAQLVVRNEKFTDFPVPVSVTLGLTSLDETEEFYEVNTNAKSVKTDLAWELLRQMAQRDPDLAEKLNIQGKDWITRGIEVARALDGMEGPWFGRIQAPNEKKKKSDNLTMAEAQFVQSLKPVLDMALFERADPQTIARVVNAYWEGIARVLPEPFDSATSPKDWTIQKGPGAYTLHRALPRVVEVVRARGKRLGDPTAYAEVLDGLRGLHGEITDAVTQEGVEVSGADFWRAGSRGAAGAFGGEAGRRYLFLMIQALLPRPSEELSL